MFFSPPADPVRRLTSDRAASGDELPQNQSHGINIRLFEGLDVFQVDPGLQHLGGHVPGRSHLRKRGQNGAMRSPRRGFGEEQQTSVEHFNHYL